MDIELTKCQAILVYPQFSLFPCAQPGIDYSDGWGYITVIASCSSFGRAAHHHAAVGVLPADDPEVGRPSIGSDRGPERSPFGPVSGRWGTGSADTPTGVGCAAGLGGDRLEALGLHEVGCFQMGSWLRAGADGAGKPRTRAT